jgi:ATP-dependent RNA helicase DDX41
MSRRPFRDIPRPMISFKAMKFPRPVLAVMAKHGIQRPTPIQMQVLTDGLVVYPGPVCWSHVLGLRGSRDEFCVCRPADMHFTYLQGLPVTLSGRDMIGVAFTGSGKTLVFCLPAVLLALEEEMKMPIVKGEGPICLILSPSRELCQQTYDVVSEYVDALAAGGFPELRVLLCMGGIGMKQQGHILHRGPHIVVATPGRLNDMLNNRKSFTLRNCRFFAVDEADRLIDQGFEEEIRGTFDNFEAQRQTVYLCDTPRHSPRQ